MRGNRESSAKSQSIDRDYDDDDSSSPSPSTNPEGAASKYSFTIIHNYPSNSGNSALATWLPLMLKAILAQGSDVDYPTRSTIIEPTSNFDLVSPRQSKSLRTTPTDSEIEPRKL